MIERVSADPSATAALIEVVREAVGNAIRHGNATSVDIAVLDSGVDLVGLIIADNGIGMAAGAAPGIGSDLFTSLAYEWASESSPRGTTITADLTSSPAATPQASPHRRGRAAPQLAATPVNPGRAAPANPHLENTRVDPLTATRRVSGCVWSAGG